MLSPLPLRCSLAKYWPPVTRRKWVQALGTGVDNLIDQPALYKDMIVTNHPATII
jgi:hypothetical protein